MTNTSLAGKLQDVAAGLLTPFDEDDTDVIRYEELAANATWLAEEGIGLVLACANISEYHSLTHEERVESVRVVCDAVGDEVTVLAGAGGSTKTAITLANEHAQHGADGIMVMPPDHAFKHADGVVEYYHRIADAVDIGVVPYLRGIDVSVPMVEGITDPPRVAGVKWAIADIELFAECVHACSNEVVWMCGMAEPPTPAYWAEGATGFSAGVTNFEPRLGLAMFDALEDGSFHRAKRLRDLSVPLMNLRGEAGDGLYPGAHSVQVVKYGLELAGRYGGPVREPLVRLPTHDRERIREAYNDLQAGLDKLLPVHSPPSD